ncbi:MAG: leucine-rich repeat domain-containing protein [Thermoguttaceae bacterium]|nr:leucine-rich repeat domain-containing protein [Thermoguttaceae bacterium]
MRTTERISKRASSFLRNFWEICVRGIIVLSSFFLRKRTLKISAGMEDIEYDELHDNPRLAKIIVSHDNPTYSSIDGVLYSKDGTKLIRFPPASKKNTFQVPDSVTSIERSAFWDCTSLTKLTIPNSVTTIGDKAFHVCSSLTKLTIPDSVTSIGEWAFAYCTSLTEITIPNSVTSIGGFAFAYCASLTEITIPNSVTSIGGGVFQGCESLTKVTIPDSVTSIDCFAFIPLPETIIAVPNSYAWNYYSHVKGIKVVAPDKE